MFTKELFQRHSTKAIYVQEINGRPGQEYIANKLAFSISYITFAMINDLWAEIKLILYHLSISQRISGNCILGYSIRDPINSLTGKDVSSEMRVQVLNNLGKYLQEEEESSVRAEEEWKKRAAEENLKEIGDVQSG